MGLLISSKGEDFVWVMSMPSNAQKKILVDFDSV